MVTTFSNDENFSSPSSSWSLKRRKLFDGAFFFIVAVSFFFAASLYFHPLSHLWSIKGFPDDPFLKKRDKSDFSAVQRPEGRPRRALVLSGPSPSARCVIIPRVGGLNGFTSLGSFFPKPEVGFPANRPPPPLEEVPSPGVFFSLFGGGGGGPPRIKNP